MVGRDSPHSKWHWLGHSAPIRVGASRLRASTASLPGVAHATARHYVTAAGAGEVGMGSPHGTTPTVMLGAASEVQQ